MRRNIFYILIIITLVGFFNPIYKLQAQTPPVDPVGTCTNSNGTAQVTQSICASIPGGTWVGPYVFLAPLPCDSGAGCDKGQLTTFDPAGAGGGALGGYLNMMIKIFIGICAVLAVIMIVVGGIQYMTTELISSKEAGKERITHAIFGLLLALGAWTLLNQINPDILKTDLKSLADVKVDVALSNSIYEKVNTSGNDYSARCTPVASGPCATDNLTSTFGTKAAGMSKICNVESGGNASAASGTDKGTDGTVFSFGLFQINLLSNGSVIKDSSGNSCADLFVRSDDSPIVRGNYIKKDSGGRTFYDAKLKPGMQNKYNDCKNTLSDPTKNTQIAGILFQQGTSAFNNSMFAWNGDAGVCASAFN